jgi:hypothetical protein
VLFVRPPTASSEATLPDYRDLAQEDVCDLK